MHDSVRFKLLQLLNQHLLVHAIDKPFQL